MAFSRCTIGHYCDKSISLIHVFQIGASNHSYGMTNELLITLRFTKSSIFDSIRLIDFCLLLLLFRCGKQILSQQTVYVTLLHAQPSLPLSVSLSILAIFPSHFSCSIDSESKGMIQITFSAFLPLLITVFSNCLSAPEPRDGLAH